MEVEELHRDNRDNNPNNNPNSSLVNPNNPNKESPLPIQDCIVAQVLSPGNVAKNVKTVVSVLGNFRGLLEGY